MKLIATELPDCYLLEPNIFEDNRGRFVKTFHRSSFDALGIQTDFKEEYYSVSDENVVRGMHFQLPPEDHYKLVYCPTGSVFDVVIDLRRGSPTFGKHVSFELSSRNGRMLYIPTGFAHGFCALEDNTVMMYRVSSEHSSEHDCGISWDSAGIKWPAKKSIISDRDQKFVNLDAFISPFIFHKE